jgi:hypothetical protein
MDKATQTKAGRARPRADDRKTIDSYMVFVARHRNAVKAAHPGASFTQLAKVFVAMWNSLPEMDRAAFNPDV